MPKETTLNCCPGVGCHAGCIHRTHVTDGKIVKVEPLSYPDGEKGVICVKGYAGSRLPYHPDRLKHPLKRVGKRGEGKWERITWEQALDEIAEKIKDIRKRFGPEAVYFSPHYNSVPYSATQMLLGHRLMNLLEATGGIYGHPVDSHPQFSGYFTYGISPATFLDPKVLTEGKTRHMIVWGCNPAVMSNRFWKYIRRARQNGAKLVDIGLITDETAKAADWFIQVKAGSDGALALAMVDVIIREGLYDEAYVRRHTNGPFLVRMDNGRLLRESDLSGEGSSTSYVVWDLEKGQACTVAPHSDSPDGSRPALLGTYAPGGIECRPAFQMVADMAGERSLKEAEAITGVSPETVVTLAREYASTKPAAILLTFGLRYKNSSNAIRVMDILGAITGNIGELGGGTVLGALSMGQMNAPLLKLNDEPIQFATEARSKKIPMAQIFQCLTTGDPYPVKAMLTYGFNFMNTYPHPTRWTEKIFPNLELIVMNDIFMTATAEYADYVLPDCTVFERDDMDIAQDCHIVWLDKAIEPMHDCRPPVYYWSELAKRLGFGKYFDKTIEEWTMFRLDSKDPSVADIDPPLTFERLRTEKIVRANLPDEVFHPWVSKVFLTPSGRLEFYNEELLPAQDALPVYREQDETPRSALEDKYPLVFNTANPMYFVHTLFANDPKMLEKYMTEPRVRINPVDAERRGVSEDDVVTIFNDRGRCRVKAMISEDVPPGVINVPYGWWPKQFVEGHPQNLVASIASLDNRDASREIHWGEVCKKHGDSDTLFWDAAMSYSSDTLFDCLCQVKKG